MSIAKTLASALESFVALLALYLAHRALSLVALTNTEMTPLLWAQTYFVGALSDVWVACLGAMLVVAAGAVVTLAGFPQIGRCVRFGLLLLLAIGATAHQGYVDFYHFQIIPFHLSYLFDLDFLMANGISLLGFKPVLVFLTFAITLSTLIFGDFLREQSIKRLTIACAAVFVGALIAHNRNIHLRVQWFVPDNLQVNVGERLYMQLNSTDIPTPLTEAETQQLAASLADEPIDSGVTARQQLLQLITKPADDARVSGVGQALQAAFARAADAGKRPLILVVLLESLRPSETGYFAAAKGLPATPSLTPTLDGIAAGGVVFTQAYATGSVTRGAQEAAFCGYLGSRDTSLMRGQTVVELECLPEMARRRGLESGREPELFWLHGGEGRFDNQLTFWEKHGVPHLLSLKDFPASAPRTSWGIGDVTFFSTAAEKLATMHRESPSRYMLGMALTVSNHIPWTLPTDLPSLPQRDNLTHPSYATTAYADAALGTFLTALKSAGLWDETLLIVASDHGNGVPPYADIYGDVPVQHHLLQSHINMLLTGGLVDDALAAQGVGQLTIGTPVSQADIAPLIAYVADLRGARFMAENPLGTARSLPVLATLEQDLFDPQAMRAYSRREAARATTTDLPVGEAKARLYFRAFLQYIYTWSGAVSGSGP